MLKLKVFNYQTGEFQQKTLTPETHPQGKCVIGRTEECDVILISPDASRLHGSIKFQNNQYHYTDLGSANGSRLNNQALKPHQSFPLKPEDLVGIGDFVLLIAAIEVPIQGSVQPAVAEQANQDNDRSPQDLPYWTKGELTVCCVRITNETPDVKTFTFTAIPPVLFQYKPGQFVTLELNIQGEPVSRSYSISSSPARPHVLEITVKRVPAAPDSSNLPAGLVSNWLHDTLKVGTLLRLNGAMGKFVCLPKPDQKLLFISAGSGITPVMSMSRWIADIAIDCDVVFFHCTRTPQDVIFRQELELMATRLPKFRLALSTTRQEPGLLWYGWTGRLEEFMLKAIAPDFQERTVYVCGPDNFMKGVKTMLEALGFPMENYYQESFGAPKKTKPQVPTPDVASHSIQQQITPRSPLDSAASSPPSSTPKSLSAQASVYFAQSKKEAVFQDVESILELAEQEGIKIRSNCRQGICGSCRKRKLEGEVRYDAEPEALEPSDREAGYILTCVACPIGKVVLEA